MTVIGPEAYPLHWPDGWPRTVHRHTDYRFEGKSFTPGQARDGLLNELRLLGAKDVIVSSNVPLRPDGIPYAQSGRLDDPGIAVYFTFAKKSMVMARDKFISVAGNLRSLTLAVSAMRQLERHGGKYMMERAFTGFIALAPPDWEKPWREVFGIKPNGPVTLAMVTGLYREKARLRHPDAGGSDTLMAELNVAYEQACRELGQ